jgi:hypothetical protein
MGKGVKEHTDLECQWKSPCNATWCKRETESEPIRDGEARDAIRHLDDNKLAPAPHLARLSLPNTSSGSVHASSQTSNDSSNHHLSNAEAASLNDCSDGDDSATQEDDSWSTEDVARPDR